MSRLITKVELEAKHAGEVSSALGLLDHYLRRLKYLMLKTIYLHRGLTALENQALYTVTRLVWHIAMEPTRKYTLFA